MCEPGDNPAVQARTKPEEKKVSGGWLGDLHRVTF
jgi:hypothetical protein